MTYVRAGLLVLAVACGGGSPATTPANTTPTATRLVIAKGQPLGWLGVAPVDKREGGDWRPAGTATLYLPSRPELPPGITFTAIDAKGAATTVTSTGEAKLPYGCDDNQLDTIALTSIDKSGLAAGAVWLLPPGAPLTWAPKALAITAFQASEARRRYTAGPIAIELERTDDTRGLVKLAWNGRVVHSLPFERGDMAGADRTPINLVEGGVGVPEPIAAWAIGGERGAVLLVLHQPSYEGQHLSVVRIEEDRAVAEEELGFYMYQCAF
jgi:hypothetical protein